ncbi:axoneme-associated protein mst101(2)-like [Heteronotia binoei]|uniref:axoneme-associated protein mst101(2)-like n=1 Tax=Heteronotia binoei TaxID=13085 RepID=UPI002930B465|nr:axoneme-associated protein mst101(2)-like [Heteronotia binoei]
MNNCKIRGGSSVHEPAKIRASSYTSLDIAKQNGAEKQFKRPFKYLERAIMPPLSFLQTEQPQVLQPFLLGLSLQPPDHPHHSPLHLLHSVHVLFEARPPERQAMKVSDLNMKEKWTDMEAIEVEHATVYKNVLEGATNRNHVCTHTDIDLARETDVAKASSGFLKGESLQAPKSHKDASSGQLQKKDCGRKRLAEKRQLQKKDCGRKKLAEKDRCRKKTAAEKDLQKKDSCRKKTCRKKTVAEKRQLQKKDCGRKRLAEKRQLQKKDLQKKTDAEKRLLQKKTDAEKRLLQKKTDAEKRHFQKKDRQKE